MLEARSRTSTSPGPARGISMSPTSITFSARPPFSYQPASTSSSMSLGDPCRFYALRQYNTRTIVPRGAADRSSRQGLVTDADGSVDTTLARRSRHKRRTGSRLPRGKGWFPYFRFYRPKEGTSVRSATILRSSLLRLLPFLANAEVPRCPRSCHRHPVDPG